MYKSTSPDKFYLTISATSCDTLNVCGYTLMGLYLLLAKAHHLLRTVGLHQQCYVVPHALTVPHGSVSHWTQRTGYVDDVKYKGYLPQECLGAGEKRHDMRTW